MLKPRLCLAQDSMENALPCPQQQSREAGSCLGPEQPIRSDSRASRLWINAVAGAGFDGNILQKIRN
jgi:hypothetical protein